jgi:Fic family protein
MMAKWFRNIHDIFVRESFSDSERAVAFFLEMIVVYALNVSEITEAQLGQTIKSIPEPLKEKIMTTFSMLIEKGKLEEKIEVIVSLFDEGFEVPKIAKIVKLSKEEVVKFLTEKGRLN